MEATYRRPPWLTGSYHAPQVENCHWGVCTDDDTSSCPTAGREWCPFNFFRTSGDVRETWNSWVRNLLTAVRFLDKDQPLSGPHCWAYPE
jgi:alpha-galactosidase